jgi:hypothetical protein
MGFMLINVQKIASKAQLSYDRDTGGFKIKNPRTFATHDFVNE